MTHVRHALKQCVARHRLHISTMLVSPVELTVGDFGVQVAVLGLHAPLLGCQRAAARLLFLQVLALQPSERGSGRAVESRRQPHTSAVLANVAESIRRCYL